MHGNDLFPAQCRVWVCAFTNSEFTWMDCMQNGINFCRIWSMDQFERTSRCITRIRDWCRKHTWLLPPRPFSQSRSYSALNTKHTRLHKVNLPILISLVCGPSFPMVVNFISFSSSYLSSFLLSVKCIGIKFLFGENGHDESTLHAVCSD